MNDNIEIINADDTETTKRAKKLELLRQSMAPFSTTEILSLIIAEYEVTIEEGKQQMNAWMSGGLDLKIAGVIEIQDLHQAAKNDLQVLLDNQAVLAVLKAAVTQLQGA